MKKIRSSLISSSGNITIPIIIMIGVSSAFFLANQQKFKDVVEGINTSINGYKENAKLLEIRLLLTDVSICESSLKGLRLDQSSDFKIRSGGNIININHPGEELSVTKLTLENTPLGSSEITSAKISVTLESRIFGKTSTKTYPLFYNFIVDNATKVVQQCLGETSEETQELFNNTITQKRQDICVDALRGIFQNGKCEWSW